MKVGLIGYGRLGKMIHHYLGLDFDLSIYDPIYDGIAKENQVSLNEINKCSIIIIAVPISAFEDSIKALSKHLIGKTCLVIDVCSVKTIPINIMGKYLPSTVSILGTHPMFGPDSAKDTLFGRKIVLTPVRIEEKTYKDITSYLQNHGIKTIEASADEHDQQISNSLNLTHLIGRTLMEFEATQLDIDTKGYRRLMKILSTVENDSWQLFQDMNNYNPYAKATITKFKKSLESIIKSLEVG